MTSSIQMSMRVNGAFAIVAGVGVVGMDGRGSDRGVWLWGDRGTVARKSVRQLPPSYPASAHTSRSPSSSSSPRRSLFFSLPSTTTHSLSRHTQRARGISSAVFLKLNHPLVKTSSLSTLSSRSLSSVQMARPRLSYSLLLACLLVLLVSPNPSSALSHAVNKPNAPRHLQHAQVVDSKKRMVKVRQINIGHGKDTTSGDNTGGTNDTGNNGGSVSASSTTTTAAAVTTPTPARTTTTAAQSSAAVQSSSAAVDSQSTVSTTTTTTPATSSVPTTTTAPSTTLNLVTQSTPSLAASSSASRSLSVATAQVTVDLPTQSADSDNTTTSANTFGRNTIIAIVVIASCVGGAAAVWTLIRKWKLGPSAKFEERMAPIEWSPDMGSTAGAGIPGAEREKTYGATEKHTRSGSHGSFHSSDAEHNNIGRNVTGNGNMFADQHPTSYAPEAHDFTAGPVHYNNTGYDAYGNPAAGYADLQRTNSNGSNRSQTGGLQRGPSDPHAGANAAAAPYAYDNGYGNAAYGHDAYAQDAYGGYDAYGQHYPAQQGQYGAQQGQYGARY